MCVCTVGSESWALGRSVVTDEKVKVVAVTGPYVSCQSLHFMGLNNESHTEFLRVSGMP